MAGIWQPVHPAVTLQHLMPQHLIATWQCYGRNCGPNTVISIVSVWTNTSVQDIQCPTPCMCNNNGLEPLLVGPSTRLLPLCSSQLSPVLESELAAHLQAISSPTSLHMPDRNMYKKFMNGWFVNNAASTCMDFVRQTWHSTQLQQRQQTLAEQMDITPYVLCVIA